MEYGDKAEASEFILCYVAIVQVLDLINIFALHIRRIYIGIKTDFQKLQISTKKFQNLVYDALQQRTFLCRIVWYHLKGQKCCINFMK
ncbi:MAG: hypothetical protein JWQ21_2327 [Herminiimonas sp.]|nr:hypothetical protein [Herminiimonas sp.]